MPGFVNYFYKDGAHPSHTKTFFKSSNILTVHNIVLKNIIIFINNIHQFPDTLPLSITNLIPHDAPSPTSVTDYCSDWYTRYNSLPFNKSVFFKGPILYTDFIYTLLNSEYSPYTSKASFKKLIKKQLLDLQGAGDEQEWEGNNFKLTAIAGLRRSERIRTQNLNNSIPCEIN